MPPGPAAWAASSTSGGEWAGGTGRFSRQAPSHGPAGHAGGRLGERRVVGQKGGRRPAGADGRVCDEPAEEREVGRYAADLGLGERVGEPGESFVPRRAVGYELRDHRVVADADLVALLDARVHPDPGRELQPIEPPGLR